MGNPGVRIYRHIDIREKPVALSCRKDVDGATGKTPAGRVRLAIACPLIGKEKERVVLPNRPADGAAKLVLMKLVRLGQKEVAGVQEGVAVKFKSIPVESD